ncbi:MAG TPA: sensor histidine kinase [Bryobacteraceae bacterium]|nr:sensor histidine kinase [Bryobacteraceae bacterium]
MLFPPKFAWERYIISGRALLAVVGLIVFYRRAPQSGIGVLFTVLGAYLFCSLALAVRGSFQGGMLGLLALVVDTIYFMVLASYGTDRLLWLVSVFFLFLLVEALASYGPWEVVGVSLVGAAICAVAMRPAERVIVTAGALASGFAVNKRRQSTRIAALEEALEQAYTANRKIGENERERIASDFHDGPLQSFISMQMRLEILRKLLDRDFNAGMEDLKQLQALAQSQVRDVRAFLHSMRPADVDGADMIVAARRTAESFQKESGIPVAFMGSNARVGLPREMALEVLQMLREALHNVQKHAGATRVAGAMEKTAGGLEISVDDNGHGFPFSGAYSLDELELLRLGPASLKRRARSLNADMSLDSRPGRGVGLKFRVPLP